MKSITPQDIEAIVEKCLEGKRKGVEYLPLMEMWKMTDKFWWPNPAERKKMIEDIYDWANNDYEVEKLDGAPPE